MTTLIKLSPSSLTFLYDECKRCFYLSLMRDFKRPTTPFPKIFSKIDNAMKDFFMGKSCKEISRELPEGKMILAQRWVESAPMEFPNHTLRPFFRGLFDAIVQFDGGGYGLIDFKTSEYAPAQLPFYQRQLSAYVHALENPAPEKLHLAPIAKMGLVYFTPDELLPYDDEHLSLKGKAHWKEIERNDKDFRNFIDEVLTVLELPDPPEPDPDCSFCHYRQQTRQTDN
jgi:hypothetical protein